MNSLCIPRAMTYTTAADVTQVFNQLFEGNFVKQVDERTQVDSHGQTFKMFYIHFFDNMTSVEMEVFKQKMEEDGMVQVMTGRGKWFWKVYVNKSTKTPAVRKGPRIMTEDDEKLFLQWKESRNQAAAVEKDPAFTEEELDVLDAAIAEESELNEEEMDELDDEHATAATHEEQKELMETADAMFVESNKPPSYAAVAKR